MPPIRKLNMSKIQIPPKQSPVTPKELFDISDSFQITINDKEYTISWPDFDRNMKIIGQGAFGIIYKAVHTETQFAMAIKKLRLTDDIDDRKQIMREKEVGIIDCPYTVKYFGFLFADDSIMMCMGIMATCTERLYQHAKKRDLSMKESVVRRISHSTLLALKYLREKKIAHRDVKPSNILVNVEGDVKLCDFGVSGSLVNSVTTSVGVGCSAYMAPEKMDEHAEINGVTVKAEIWSLGISLIEITTMEPIYLKKYTQFQCACKIVKDPPPTLPSEFSCSDNLRNFVSACLTKSVKLRPNFSELLESPFIVTGDDSGKESLAEIVMKIADLLPALND